MTRILFCTSGYFPDMSGGAEHQARLQAEEMARRGHRVSVVCPRRRGARSRTVGGIRIYRLPVIERPYLRELSYSLLLFFFLMWHARRVQLIHIHMTHLDAGVICVVARLWKRPVYAKIARGGAGGDSSYIGRKWYLRRTALAYPARFQAISGQIQSELRALGVPDRRIVSIPNGVELPEHDDPPDARRQRLRSSLGLPGEAPIVLFLGRFVRMKGLDILLEAWSGMPAGMATLLVVGRRPGDRDILAGSFLPRAGAATSGVLARDWTDSPGDYMAAADIFVLPSRGEGMSNALLRAMAEGLPVIATRVGAAEAMIQDDVTGCLVPVEDAERLRAAICELAADAGRRQRLGAAARARAAQSYSIASVVDRIAVAYAEILAER